MHIITTASITVQYQDLLTVREDQPYHYRMDDYQLDGWSISSSFIVGYMIPVIEDKKKNFQSFRRLYTRDFTIFPLLNVNLKFDLTHYNDSRMDHDGWGSDFINVTLNPMLIFHLPCNYSLNLFFEFKNARRFKENTIGNLYMFDRQYEDWYFKFATVGIIWTWKF